MTTIQFERTGGFMGRKVSLSLDLDSLPSDQAETLRGLLETCDFFSQPESASGSPVPDEFTYKVSVDTGTVQHTIVTTDSTMSDSLRPLLEELGNKARTK